MPNANILEKTPVSRLRSPRSKPNESRTRSHHRKVPNPHEGVSFSILGPASSCEFIASENSDRGAIGKECGAWMTLKDMAQFDPVQQACITFKSCRGSHPHLPRHLSNVIFHLSS